MWSRNLENEEVKARYRAVKIQPKWVVTPGKQTTTDNIQQIVSKYSAFLSLFLSAVVVSGCPCWCRLLTRHNCHAWCDGGRIMLNIFMWDLKLSHNECENCCFVRRCTVKSVDKYEHHEDEGSSFWRKVIVYLLNYMASHPKRQPLSRNAV